MSKPNALEYMKRYGTSSGTKGRICGMSFKLGGHVATEDYAGAAKLARGHLAVKVSVKVELEDEDVLTHTDVFSGPVMAQFIALAGGLDPVELSGLSAPADEPADPPADKPAPRNRLKGSTNGHITK